MEKNVPKLRFKRQDGSDYPDWVRIKADELFDNVSDKNHPEETVLTIIQGIGTVPRSESGMRISYDKDSVKNYKKVEKGDFIIHLRSFQGGLEIANSKGVVSPAYTILRSKNPINTSFYRNYFRSDKFIRKTLTSAVEGIRDGKQISFSQFKTLKVISADIEEQKKIGNFLSTIDSRITLQSTKVDTLTKLKKGIMQKIFSQEIRFKREDGGDYPDWGI